MRCAWRRLWLAASLAAAGLVPGAAGAWDVRCIPFGAADPDEKCEDPFEHARTPWGDHRLAEHRRLLVESLARAGLPASLLDEFQLTVYAGSELVGEGAYESVRPVRTGAEREQVRTLAIPMMASLPDFSYTLWDWASGNELCPPDPGHPAFDCHNYESHIGWLNSNHMLPQARHWYGYLHSLAVERAEACKDLVDGLEVSQRTRFQEWLLACEREALVIEAVAQHYLQDAWAIGHMMARWGSTEIADFGFDRGLGFVISGFAGAIHGSKAMLDDHPEFGVAAPWDDPINAPHADVGYIDGLDGPVPLPGVGDRFLLQLLGQSAGLASYAHQSEALFGCAVDGLREVYTATARLHGTLGAVGAGVDGRRQVEADSCWVQRVTNRAFETGIGVHRGAFGSPLQVRLIPGVVGWTVSDIVGNFLLDAPVTTPEVRARFQTDAAYVATVAALYAGAAPDGTFVADGAELSLAGIGSNAVYARGGPGEPPSGYSDPPLPWTLSDAVPAVAERKEVLNLTFADAHAADRCGELGEAELEAYVDDARAAEGGDPDVADAACGQCVQMIAPHLRFGRSGDHDPNREAFCALVDVPSGSPGFLYTGESGPFIGTEPADLGSLRSAARTRCCPGAVAPLRVEAGVGLEVEATTDAVGESDALGKGEGGAPFNGTLTAESEGGSAVAAGMAQTSSGGSSGSASGSGSASIQHSLNDDEHDARASAASGFGAEICVTQRSTFSAQAQVQVSGDAEEASAEGEVSVCCDANGDPIEDFASDEPGGDNVAQVSLSGVLCDGALARAAPRGLFCECVGVSVELDLLLQEGQTEGEGSWTANLSVAPAP